MKQERRRLASERGSSGAIPTMRAAVVGNHDASGPDEPTQWWFRKWIDPTGENTKFSGVNAQRRPYPITGTWERYSFRVGNLLFLMMGDRNDGSPPVGRGKRGGYPSGAVTGETFEWWKRNVETNEGAVIISAPMGKIPFRVYLLSTRRLMSPGCFGASPVESNVAVEA